VPVLPPPSRTPNQSPKERPKDDPAKGWVKWSIAHEQLAHETRAYAGSFGDHDADAVIPSFVELYDGVVTVSTEDPGLAGSESEARFVRRWPEATCEAHVWMRLDSDAAEYRLHIDLTTAEDGRERWGRSWDRTFRRNLQ